MGLKGKKILITAGPTWVPIDDVRIISNVATGRTGILLAREAAVRRAEVTLVLGPGEERVRGKLSRLIRFRFFSELKDILKRELKNKKYDIVIHSAAVSDFKPDYKLKGKLNSDKGCRLKLIPLEKLVVLIRRFAPKSILVMFKLEPTVTDKTLIQRAKSSRDMVGADMVVANRLSPYRAFIIDKENNQIKAQSKQELAKKLIKVLLKD
jgi:phosphopantothenoylcysteine decarboxylase/phosphopantothenate--cysteine ligase